ncbi:MAG: TolB family protein, partial [Candidatus Acidiferrales bacterium]
MKIADWFLALLLTLMLIPPAAAQTPAKHDMSFADLIAMHRVSDIQISPDGKMVAYAVATPDLEANRNASNIWVVPVEGGSSRQVTRSGHDTRPRWSPDGTKIAFLSSRDGTPQVFTILLAGGEASKITNLSTGADNELWSPDGKRIAFVSNVYPDCRDDECNRKRNEEKEKSKVKARIYGKLLYRHWTEWWDGTRSHLFVQAAEGGAARDLTQGADYDVPPFNMGAPEAIAFSPDSRELCFTADTDKDEALSTNDDLFIVRAEGDT